MQTSLRSSTVRKNLQNTPAPGPQGRHDGFDGSLQGRPLRGIAGFAVRFTLVFAMLSWPSESLQREYADIFIAAARAGLSNCAGRIIGFSSVEKRSDSGAHDASKRRVLDVRISLRSPDHAGHVAYYHTSSRHIGYIPTAMIIALALATPLTLKRRMRGLLLGLVIVHAYIGLRVLVTVIFALSQDATIGFHSGPAVNAVLRQTYWLLGPSLGGSLIAPIPIWIVATFRRADAKMLIANANPRSIAAGTIS